MTDTTKPQTLEEAFAKEAASERWSEDCGCPDAGHTRLCVNDGFGHGAKWGASFALDAEPTDKELVDMLISEYGEGQDGRLRLSMLSSDAVFRAWCVDRFNATLAARKKRLGL